MTTTTVTSTTPACRLSALNRSRQRRPAAEGAGTLRRRSVRAGRLGSVTRVSWSGFAGGLHGAGRRAGRATTPVRQGHLRPWCEQPGIADVLRREGQQRQVAGPLDGHRQAALVLGARTRLAPRLNLAALRQVASQPVRVLVIDDLHLLYTEGAHLAPRHVARPLLGGLRRGSGCRALLSGSCG